MLDGWLKGFAFAAECGKIARVGSANQRLEVRGEPEAFRVFSCAFWSAVI